MLAYHTKQLGILQQELLHSIHPQATVIFVLKKSTESCLNQEEPHSIRGLNFFATAITKHLNFSKIFQSKTLQTNTKFNIPIYNNIFSKFYNKIFSKFYNKIFKICNTFTLHHYLFIYLFIPMYPKPTTQHSSNQYELSRFHFGTVRYSSM